MSPRLPAVPLVRSPDDPHLPPHSPSTVHQSGAPLPSTDTYPCTSAQVFGMARNDRSASAGMTVRHASESPFDFVGIRTSHASANRRSVKMRCSRFNIERIRIFRESKMPIFRTGGSSKYTAGPLVRLDIRPGTVPALIHRPLNLPGPAVRLAAERRRTPQSARCRRATSSFRSGASFLPLSPDNATSDLTRSSRRVRSRPLAASLSGGARNSARFG